MGMSVSICQLSKASSERCVSFPKLSKLELESNPGLGVKPLLIPLNPSASQVTLLPSALTASLGAGLRGRVWVRWMGSSSQLLSSHYFLSLCYIYLFPFINNSRKQKCIQVGNKYPSLCECHTFLCDTNAQILHCLHYASRTFFFRHYGIECARNAPRHRLKKRWS